MRVLHLGNGNMFGGIETLLVSLARLQRSNGLLENHFLLSHRGRLSAELQGAGFNPLLVEGARLRHPWSVLRARLACRARVRELCPDVVVAHGPWAYVVFGSGVPAEIPLVFFQHGAAAQDTLHRLARCRTPAGVIANSTFTASTTPEVFPGVPVQVCRCPLDPPRATRPREAVRAELAVGDEPVVVQTSRLEPWKGQQLLLAALSRLKALPWRLWLAGGQSRPAEAQFRRELDSAVMMHGLEDRVTFLGEREDVSDVLGAADVFCQPNIEREPYGITLIEAMSAGLPIVATDLGATADDINPDLGRRVTVDSVALAEALRELLTDKEKRLRLGCAARRHFEECYSPTAALEALHHALGALARSQSERALWV